MTESSFIPTGCGGVQAWECDENAHLNVQFYAARLNEATPFVLDAVGLGPDSGLGLLPGVHHTRYLRELRMGDTTLTRSRVVGIGQDSLTVYHEFLGQDALAASFIAIDRLVDLRTGAAASWPQDVLERLTAWQGEIPQGSRPRTLSPEAPAPLLTLAEADELGMVETHRGPVTPQQCDLFGTLAPQFVVGRVSDGVPHLWAHLGLDRTRMLDTGRGSIVLETKMSYLSRPQPGDILVGRSALVEIMGRTLRFAHILFDKRTGLATSVNEAVVTTLDLKARKAVGFSEEEKQALAGHLKVLPSKSA